MLQHGLDPDQAGAADPAVPAAAERAAQVHGGGARGPGGPGARQGHHDRRRRLHQRVQAPQGHRYVHSL